MMMMVMMMMVMVLVLVLVLLVLVLLVLMVVVAVLSPSQLMGVSKDPSSCKEQLGLAMLNVRVTQWSPPFNGPMKTWQWQMKGEVGISFNYKDIIILTVTIASWVFGRLNSSFFCVCVCCFFRLPKKPDPKQLESHPDPKYFDHERPLHTLPKTNSKSP